MKPATSDGSIGYGLLGLLHIGVIANVVHRSGMPRRNRSRDILPELTEGDSVDAGDQGMQECLHTRLWWNGPWRP